MDITPTKNTTYNTEVTNNSFRLYNIYTNHILIQYETYSVSQLQPRKNEWNEWGWGRNKKGTK